MQLNLTNSIIIIDEAHNIEDSCRSSAGLEIDLDTIESITKEFAGIFHPVGSQNPSVDIACPESHAELRSFVLKFNEWMSMPNHVFNDATLHEKLMMYSISFNASCKGNSILDCLLAFELTTSRVSLLQSCINNIDDHHSQVLASQEPDFRRFLSSGSRNVIECTLFLIFSYTLSS